MHGLPDETLIGTPRHVKAPDGGGPPPASGARHSKLMHSVLGAQVVPEGSGECAHAPALVQVSSVHGSPSSQAAAEAHFSATHAGGAYCVDAGSGPLLLPLGGLQLVGQLDGGVGERHVPGQGDPVGEIAPMPLVHPVGQGPPVLVIPVPATQVEGQIVNAGSFDASYARQALGQVAPLGDTVAPSVQSEGHGVPSSAVATTPAEQPTGHARPSGVLVAPA